jgi:hypothetical protein
MSGRLLDFKTYLGGASSVQVIEMFPNDQKTFQYDFNTNVSGYQFSADYESILLDTVTYDRVSGNINLADTTVTGYFTNQANVTSGYINNASASSGIVEFTIPPNRYAGNVLPNARDNVVCTVLSFQWETDDTPNTQKQRHRWAIIERYDPQVGKTPGDPALESTYVPFGVGAITGVTVSGADASRTAGTYNNLTGLTSGSGSDATFQIVVDGSGAATVNITGRGTNYRPNDTIEILDSNLGSGGAADVTITVSSIA